MELTREQIRQRQAKFPSLIIELSWSNPIIHKMVGLYSHGTIVSKEEAYCQMIRELSVTYNQMVERLTDEARMKATIFNIQPPNE